MNLPNSCRYVQNIPTHDWGSHHRHAPSCLSLWGLTLWSTYIAGGLLKYYSSERDVGYEEPRGVLELHVSEGLQQQQQQRACWQCVADTELYQQQELCTGSLTSHSGQTCKALRPIP